MSRRPRRPRWQANTNTLHKALMRAARLTPAEVDQIMITVRPQAQHVLAGVGTHADWLALAGACTLALAIEAQGIVRGLSEHLRSAERALNAIIDRAQPDHQSATPGPWRATPLRYDERDAIACLVDLFAFQLAQLSAGELQAATAQAEARVRQAGGVVILQAIDSRSDEALHPAAITPSHHPSTIATTP